MTNVSIPVEQRQLIFKALIESQDGGMSVPQSRTDVSRTFGITVDQVKEIEREGLEEQWPPL